MIATRTGASQRKRKFRSKDGRKTTSRYKGVSFDKKLKRWRATIVVDGRQRTLGRYRTQGAAARAYDEAAREHFGPTARLNFPLNTP